MINDQKEIIKEIHECVKKIHAITCEEPLDGDETEKIVNAFRIELDYVNGNK